MQPYVVGTIVQWNLGLSSLFGGLRRNATSLLKRGAMALGNRALRIGMHIVAGVMPGQNFKQVAKRRDMDAGKDLMSNLSSTPGVRPQQQRRRQHRKCATVTQKVIAQKIFRKGQSGEVRPKETERSSILTRRLVNN